MSMNSGYSIPGPGLSGNLSKDILILVDSKWTLMLAAHSEKVYIYICFPVSFSHPYFFGFFPILQIFVTSQHYINVDVKTTINFYFSELSTYLCRAFYGAKNAFPTLIELSHMIEDPKFQV